MLIPNGMFSDAFPMIAPLPFEQHTPESWLAYVKSLYQTPEKKAPKEEISFKRTKTGKPQLTVRRDPKIILLSELEKISAETGCPINELWNYARKKKISVLKEKK